MKGYEDLCAGLMVLSAVLLGGYFYLNAEVIQQRSVLQTPDAKKTESRSEKTMFEVVVKRTE